MSTAFDWSKYEKKPVEQEGQAQEIQNEGAFDWSKYEKQPELSKGRSVGNAFVKGAVDLAQEISSLNPFSHGPISQALGSKLVERALPTKDEDAEKLIRRGTRVAGTAALGPGGIVLKGAEAALGTVGGAIAEANEAGPLGQALAEGGGMLLPSAAKLATKAVVKAAQNLSTKFGGVAEKTPSGLTKLKALEAGRPELAVITPERQTAAIAKVNEEASAKAKGILETEKPIIKEIEAGHDFGAEWEKEFGELRGVAEKSNPVIETDPLIEFLAETEEKLSGVPELHAQGKKIMKEIRAFIKNPQAGMKNLLRTYRSNNKKMKEIYETSRVTGRQQEYVDFLTEMNKKIDQSFGETLGETSPWVKRFRANNARYKSFKDAERGMQLLQPIIGKEPTAAALAKLAEDPRKQKQLSLAIGEKGANEVVQLAKDQKAAHEALNKMTVKKLSALEAVFPLSFFIPGFHIPKGIAMVHKLGKFSQRGYGYLLTTPVMRKNHSAALKAIQNADVAGYEAAVSKIFGEMGKEKE